MATRSGNARQPFETIADKIKDQATREALDRIQQFLNGMLLSRFDGDHFEVVFTKTTGQTVFSYAHNFRFTPKDVWITYQNQDLADTISVNWLGIDATNVAFYVGGVTDNTSVTLRFFAGTFTEEV